MAGNLDINIEATERTQSGKGNSRKLRAAGKIPAVLNHKGQSTKIELDPKLLSKAWLNNDKQFNLTLKGQTKKVKITELQVHPVKRIAFHVDLAYVE
jgi:large subunit ribosomal protein L25